MTLKQGFYKQHRLKKKKKKVEGLPSFFLFAKVPAFVLPYFKWLFEHWDTLLFQWIPPGEESKQLQTI